MVAVGDRVLVMSSHGENVAIPFSSPVPGDRVCIYPLQDNTEIAVPSLAFDLHAPVFVTPNFAFAGFDWHLDFEFQLLALIGMSQGIHGLERIVSYNIPFGDPTYNQNVLTEYPNFDRSTMLGDTGSFIGAWSARVNLTNVDTVEIWEATSPNFHTMLEINPNAYIYPNEYLWQPVPVSEKYLISFTLPNLVRIYCLDTIPPGKRDAGHITGCIVRSIE